MDAPEHDQREDLQRVTQAGARALGQHRQRTAQDTAQHGRDHHDEIHDEREQHRALLRPLRRSQHQRAGAAFIGAGGRAELEDADAGEST
jgi:hypothetical protein